jgi:hypothetical protein
MTCPYFNTATKTTPPIELPRVAHSKKMSKIGQADPLTGQQSDQHLDRPGDRMVQVDKPDRARHQQNDYDLADRIPAGGDQPGEQPHQPAGQHAGKQDGPPRVVDQAGADRPQRLWFDHPQAMADDDDQPGKK